MIAQAISRKAHVFALLIDGSAFSRTRCERETGSGESGDFYLFGNRVSGCINMLTTTDAPCSQ